jgi:hypothetical protein
MQQRVDSSHLPMPGSQGGASLQQGAPIPWHPQWECALTLQKQPGAGAFTHVLWRNNSFGHLKPDRQGHSSVHLTG